MGKYEEALERAKQGLPIDEVFPELKESEDERIRKELISYLAHRIDVTAFIDEGEDCKRWLAYLEKQKEQKPVARENNFVSKPKNSVEILKHYLTWATSEEENCPYSWRALADAIRDGIKALEEQKPAEWSEEDGLARDFLLKQTEQYIKVLESLSTEKHIGKKGIVDVASELSNWKNARSFIVSLQPHWTLPATSTNLG